MIASRLALAWTASFAFFACSSSPGSPSGGSTDDGNTGGAATTGSDAGSSQTPNPGTTPNPGDAGATTSTPAADAGVGGTTSPTDAKIVLDIPASFTGTTRELDVVVTPTVPIAGPPAGVLYQVEKPVVTAGEPLTIHGDTTGVSGKYYVVVVLYMQGGGQFSPKTGVDYEAQTTTTVSFGGGAVDLGTLSLSLASSDGGI